MPKLDISEDTLREVLLSMSGDDIQRIFLEARKGDMVAEMMDSGVEPVMEAVESLDMVEFVKGSARLLDFMDSVKETAEESWPEEIEKFFSEYFGLDRNEDFIEGLKEGIRLYSYMKDGVSYVGTTGKTLKDTLEEIACWHNEVVQFKLDEIHRKANTARLAVEKPSAGEK